jgi:hypothetical protein
MFGVKIGVRIAAASAAESAEDSTLNVFLSASTKNSCKKNANHILGNDGLPLGHSAYPRLFLTKGVSTCGQQNLA